MYCIKSVGLPELSGSCIQYVVAGFPADGYLIRVPGFVFAFQVSKQNKSILLQILRIA
jgi:hypothetical protein